MKKIYLLVFVLLATSFAFAQGPQGGGGQFSAEQIAQRNSEWMKKDLNLTEAQIAPVDSINLLYAKAQVALMQSANGDRESIRTAMQELTTKKEAALSAVLSGEQLDLYKQRMSEMRNRTGRPRGN